MERTDDQQYGGGVTGRVSEKLKYKEVLFDLVLMTNRSTDMAEFKKNLDLIECLLSPYAYERDKKGELVYAEEEQPDGTSLNMPKQDEIYANLIRNARHIFIRELEKWEGKSIPESDYYGYEWTYLKAKYAALMNLAFRRNMLPQYELEPKVI